MKVDSMNRRAVAACLALTGALLAGAASAYPLDAYPETGVRRLEDLGHDLLGDDVASGPDGAGVLVGHFGLPGVDLP